MELLYDISSRQIEVTKLWKTANLLSVPLGQIVRQITMLWLKYRLKYSYTEAAWLHCTFFSILLCPTFSSHVLIHSGVSSDVSHNVISGNITELFDHLGELTELDVSFNHFDSYLPLLNGTTKIRHLFVGNNSLIGTIHQSYTSLATLKVLYVLFFDLLLF